MKIGDKVRTKKSVFKNNEYNDKEFTLLDIEEDAYHFVRGELDFLVHKTALDEFLEIGYEPKHAKEPNPVAGLFCAMANIDEKVLVHRSVCNKLNDIYEQKNEKYGDSFGISVKKYGLISALTRISDKFNRFEQLVLEGSNGTDDETLLDTCLDTANYFIMTAMELQERGK
ncbi:hypothetical protein [Methanobrevibacter sp.]|uniref:hypothetical protein n=1 Tax=Methanobrevibacter sp. TaxID=66852 RepID=UPI00388EB9F4